MKKKRILVLTALFFVGTEGRQGHSVEVWFTPTTSIQKSSPDYLNLFSEPDLWASSRSKIDVFKIINWQVLGDCPNMTGTPPEQRPCGNNLIVADAYRKLRNWNIALALEAGVIKEHDCTGTRMAQEVVGQISFIESMGGHVEAIAMDEPLVGAQKIEPFCGLSLDEAVERTAWWIEYAKTIYPHLRIGDIEAYPLYRAVYPALADPNKRPPSLQQWMIKLDKKLKLRGLKLDFFHLDVDINFLNKLDIKQKQWQWEFKQLAISARKRGIAFGIIINAAPNKSSNSCEYTRSALYFLEDVMAGLSDYLDHIIFQSWSPEGIPVSLPETYPCSHTWLVNKMKNKNNADRADNDLKMKRVK